MSIRHRLAECCLVVLLLTATGYAAVSDVADAAMKKNMSAVRSLLQQKADVNAPQADGATALHWAVQSDDLQMAELLIGAGANVKSANRFGVTPLSLACINGNAAMIEKLLSAGADPNAPLSELAETPVMMAARTGSVAAVKVLLDHGANVNAKEKSKGHTALMWAAAEAHPAVVKLLMERGADVNARSNMDVPAAGGRRGGGAAAQPAPQNAAAANAGAAAAGQRGAVPQGGGAGQRGGAGAPAAPNQPEGGAPPVQRAAQQPPPCPAKNAPRPEPVFGVAGPAARPKATAGGCINALILAARQNDKETVRTLIEGGADVNLPMSDGTTALVVAITNAHNTLAALLLEKGADPNLQDGKGQAALYAAVDQRNVMTSEVPQAKPDDLDFLDLIKTLLARGANVNARLTSKLPFRGGGNPTWQSEVGATPFLRAAYSNDVTVMRLLLAFGADPNINASDQTTPLMAAAGVGWLPSLVYTRNDNLVESLKLCLELGNDVNAINDGKPNSGGPSGLTALHGAAFKGLPEAVQFLVDRGAKLDAKDPGTTEGGARGVGRTPLDWAEGVYFEGQPPRREEKTVALLRKLMSAR